MNVFSVRLDAQFTSLGNSLEEIMVEVLRSQAMEKFKLKKYQAQLLGFIHRESIELTSSEGESAMQPETNISDEN